MFCFSLASKVATIGPPAYPWPLIASSIGFTSTKVESESVPNKSSISLFVLSELGEISSASTIDLTTPLACTIKFKKSCPLKASQNSNWAVLWSKFLTLSISLAPGSSTNILPELPSLWMLGWVTPNLSILFLKTSNAETIDSSIFSLITGCTSSSDMSKVISSLNVLLANMSGDASFVSPLIASNATKKSSRYVFWLFFWISSASTSAWLKIGSLLLLDSPFNISLTEIWRITLIPPFKSRPKFIALSLTSLKV